MYNARKMSPEDAVKNNVGLLKNLILKDEETINKNHDFYFQIQGQLHISGRQTCILIIWTPLGMKSYTIEKDDEFWKKMEPRLTEFYFDCLLPEIVDSRIARNMEIREPDSVVNARKSTTKRKLDTKISPDLNPTSKNDHEKGDLVFLGNGLIASTEYYTTDITENYHVSYHIFSNEMAIINNRRKMYLDHKDFLSLKEGNLIGDQIIDAFMILNQENWRNTIFIGTHLSFHLLEDQSF